MSVLKAIIQCEQMLSMTIFGKNVRAFIRNAANKRQKLVG